MVRICIAGAGVVDGYSGAKLVLADRPANVLARGVTLQALRAEGLCLTEDGNTRSMLVYANDDAHAFDAQDVVAVAVKAPVMESVAQSIVSPIGPGTCVVVVMNGVPW